MSIERTEKEPITSREINFRELELSENRWVWNGVETGNPLWIKYLCFSGNLAGIGYIDRKNHIFRNGGSAYRSEGTDSGQYTERMDPGTANRTDPAGISAGNH